MQYDPGFPPDPEAWLSLDELDRLDLIAAWHEESDEPLPASGDWMGHAAIHVIVENQAALGEELPVRATIERLVREGLDRHEAVHAVGSVLLRFSGDMMADESDGEFDMAGYTAALEALTADDWRGSEPEDPVEDTPDEPPPAPVWRASPQSGDFGEVERDLLASFLEAHRSEGALSYPQAAGFLFAVLACPDLVKPSEWMPEVLGEAVFDGETEANEVFGALMTLYNWIAIRVDYGEAPLPPGCEPATEAMANFADDAAFGGWSRGFCLGHAWLEDSWGGPAFDAMEEELGAAMMALSFFTSREMAEGLLAETGHEKQIEDIAGTMLEMVPDAFHVYAGIGRDGRRARVEARKVPARSHKIGRNEPCPCGSGKKYKNCCGRNQ